MHLLLSTERQIFNSEDMAVVTNGTPNAKSVRTNGTLFARSDQCRSATPLTINYVDLLLTKSLVENFLYFNDTEARVDTAQARRIIMNDQSGVHALLDTLEF